MTTTIGMAEFFDKVSKKCKSKKEKVDALRMNNSFELRTTLQAAFDPRIRWLLPSGAPPFTVNTLPDQEGVYLRECKKLLMFVDCPEYAKLNQVKRETLFVQLLENVTPADARMLLSMKEKKLPWTNITEDIVREALPNLLSPKEEEVGNGD